MSVVTKSPKLFPIPTTERETTCKSCGAPVYFVLQPSGARMPVEVRGDVVGARHPAGAEPGAGTSHFATCPHADLHRRRR